MKREFIRNQRDKTDHRMIAGMAMQGILSDPEDWGRIRRDGKLLSCPESVAVYAVRMADHLMKEIGR